MRFLIPLLVLLALIALFYVGMQRDPRLVPSPLVGKAAPASTCRRSTARRRA